MIRRAVYVIGTLALALVVLTVWGSERQLRRTISKAATE